MYPYKKRKLDQCNIPYEQLSAPVVKTSTGCGSLWLEPLTASAALATI